MKAAFAVSSGKSGRLNRTVTSTRNWPMAGAQVVEFDATLQTFKALSDWPVWSEQFRESAIACQSVPVLRSVTPKEGLDRMPLFNETGVEVPTLPDPLTKPNWRR